MVMEPATAGTAEADFAPGSALLLETPAAMIALEISSRNARVAAIPKCWDRLRAGLDLILERGADMADLHGGASGLLVRGYKGKESDDW